MFRQVAHIFCLIIQFNTHFTHLQKDFMCDLVLQVAVDNNSIFSPLEAEDNPLVKSRGMKRSKICPITERQEVEIERDITILKNPNSFINDVIQEQNMFLPHVIKRIITNAGDNSMKVINSTLNKHKDSKISYPGQEKKVNFCFRVNRAIIMVYCKDLKEDYNSMR